MSNIKSDTIGAFNGYLDRLEAELGNIVEFNFLLFNSLETEKRHARVKLSQVQRLSDENFRPDGWTPLIDACVKTIKATEEAVKSRLDDPRVIVVFLTDGAENTSREYRRSDLADLIKAKTKAGWQFVYMGANIDAYSDAQSFGIDRGQTMSYVGQNSEQAMAATARNTVAFASGLVGSMAYSARQKLGAGDKFDKPPVDNQFDAAKKRRPVKPIVEDITL